MVRQFEYCPVRSRIIEKITIKGDKLYFIQRCWMVLKSYKRSKVMHKIRSRWGDKKKTQEWLEKKEFKSEDMWVFCYKGEKQDDYGRANANDWPYSAKPLDINLNEKAAWGFKTEQEALDFIKFIEIVQEKIRIINEEAKAALFDEEKTRIIDITQPLTS